jgi:protein-tyrosine phosphatase
VIDLHSHILPAVDDGARDFEQAIRMCRMARADGCRAIVATPHLRHARYWNDDRALLEARWRELRERVGPGIEILLGGEIAINGESLDEIDLLPEGGQLLTLAGTHYLLLELDFGGVGPDPVEMVYELGVAGWRPIIAHPERISWLMNDPAMLEEMVANGATMQITAMSLIGDFGPIAADAANWLLDHGLVHYVSSDTHDDHLRPPGLSRARKVVAEGWGEELAEALFVTNPRAVVRDRPLPSPPSPKADAQSKRGLVDRLFPFRRP